MRIYTNGKEALYKAHLAKDTDGMDEDGILQNLPSDCTVMHDHLLHNYCDDYSYKNIECNAHITRKLQSITENTTGFNREAILRERRFTLLSQEKK